MKHTNRGSTLLITMVLGIIMLFAVGALLTSSMTEYRNAYRHQLGVTAFSLAESGIERAAHAIMSGDVLDWTKINSDTWEKTFTVARSDLGGSSGEYVVSVRKVDDNYTVISRSTVQRSNLSVRKGVKVEFVMSNSAVPGVARGMVAIQSVSFTGGNDINQRYTLVDSYKSKDNYAPSATNRGNKAFVGTLSTTDEFNVSNGDYYATIFAGNANNVKVKTAANGSGYLVSMDDLSTSDLTLKTYDQSLVRTDVTFDWEFPIPPDAKASDGWIQVLPKGGTNVNGDWRKNGVLKSFDSNSSKMSVNGDVATIGLADTDKHYVACGSLTGINTINIAGEVVILFTSSCKGEVLNLDNALLNINFVTPNAKLTIYSDANLSGAQNIKTTQQMYYSGNKIDNWEAKRLKIVMLPGNSKINMASLNPVAVQTHVESAIKAGATSGGSIIFHNSAATFVGQIFAPYSDASLDCAITYCGSFFTNKYTVSGNCKLTFHYDASLEDSGDSEKTLSVSSWVEIVP